MGGWSLWEVFQVVFIGGLGWGTAQFICGFIAGIIDEVT